MEARPKKNWTLAVWGLETVVAVMGETFLSKPNTANMVTTSFFVNGYDVQ
jgi:hypothetical protein